MQRKIIDDWTMNDQEAVQEEKSDVHTPQRTPYQALQAGTCGLDRVLVHIL